MLNFITWTVNPNLYEGFVTVRWYGLMFAIGFLVGYWIMHRIFRHEGAPEKWLGPLFFFVVIATVLGARLGHVFFYEWDHYSQHPGDILKIWEGGLASHGGTIGIIIAIFLYSWFVTKKSVLWTLDRLAVPVGFVACLIRLGNLMNSEIIGKVTDVPWAFIFERVDSLPRHPGQLYEAICYAIFFGIHWIVYRKKPQLVGTGFFFGLCLFLIFTSRIFIELTKENQEAFEDGMLFNMGQLLSVPFVLLGLYWMFKALSSSEQTDRSSKG